MQIKKSFKRLKAMAVAFAVACVVNPLTTFAYELNSPTQQDIINMYNQHPFVTTSDAEYDSDYSLTEPYSQGDITDETRQQALNAVNFCRYVAGLPADIELDENYNQLTQAGSLVNAVNDVLSHYPEQPANMPDDLYNQGYEGTSHSNIASGYRSVSASILGYMDDSDQYNIEVLGHRRWVLSPTMQYTGFGCVDRYSGMYAVDMSRQDSFTGDYVCWPAKNMPYELYDSICAKTYAFSVTLGNKYDKPSLDDVTVTVTSNKLGKTWNIDSTCRDITGVYLNVDNRYYGSPKCIIFSVGEKFPEDDNISVTINGIKKSGVESPISYNVQMFNMFEHSFKTEYTVHEGESITVGSDCPVDANLYSWAWSANGCVNVSTGINAAVVTGVKAGKIYMRATKKNDGTVYNITVNVLPAELELKYQLLDVGDGTYGIRLVLTADEEAVKNTSSAKAWFTISDSGNTSTISVNRAYRSIIAAGKTITAGEGKVFLIGKIIGVPEEMLDGTVGHFQFGNTKVDKTIEYVS